MVVGLWGGFVSCGGEQEGGGNDNKSVLISQQAGHNPRGLSHHTKAPHLVLQSFLPLATKGLILAGFADEPRAVVDSFEVLLLLMKSLVYIFSGHVDTPMDGKGWENVPEIAMHVDTDESYLAFPLQTCPKQIYE